MNRRAFVGGSLGAGALRSAGRGSRPRAAATEDELAFANFGVSTEFLVKDFYTKALEAKVVSAAQTANLKRGRSAAAQHAKALSDLLRGAGDVAPAPEDFDFQWPAARSAARRRSRRRASPSCGRCSARTRRLPRRSRARPTACSTRASPRASASRSALWPLARDSRRRAVSRRHRPRSRERRARGLPGIGGRHADAASRSPIVATRRARARRPSQRPHAHRLSRSRSTPPRR